jgi:nitroreductase
MDTFDAINQRRSVKAFDPAHRFTASEETKLFEAAIQSPTSFNMQNWRFVVVRDTELRKQIRAAAVDQAQATDASLLIVLTADLKAWKKSPERYWRNAAPEIQKLVTGWMGPFYEGKEQLQRDEAMRSCGIAGQTIMLAAQAMGYDSCPMIGFDQVKVAEIINLPSDHVIGFMIAVGKPAKPAMPRADSWPCPRWWSRTGSRDGVVDRLGRLSLRVVPGSQDARVSTDPACERPDMEFSVPT